MRTNRLRTYHIHEHGLVMYLTSMAKWPDVIEQAIINDVPDDATIERVHYDLSRRCLSVQADGSFRPEGFGRPGRPEVLGVAMESAAKGETCQVQMINPETWRDRPPLT